MRSYESAVISSEMECAGGVLKLLKLLSSHIKSKLEHIHLYVFVPFLSWLNASTRHPARDHLHCHKKSFSSTLLPIPPYPFVISPTHQQDNHMAELLWIRNRRGLLYKSEVEVEFISFSPPCSFHLPDCRSAPEGFEALLLDPCD